MDEQLITEQEVHEQTSMQKDFDVAVVGGGLAGLSLSILLVQKGYTVALFEKEKYPFHKVCGEYLSLESREFLIRLGLKPDEMQLPVITRLTVSSPNGNCIRQKLPLGGMGISRFTLDSELSRIARYLGVKIFEETKVNDISFNNNEFIITAPGIKLHATAAAGAFGKRSNIDVKWNRPFIQKRSNPLNNYIAVKYHVHCDQPADTIALHNFYDGYCGISRIEENKYCLCYLTTAANLKASGNSIPDMEKNILCKNPFLEKIFTSSSFLPGFPVVISQISFDKKSPVENKVLMVGDTAGMITPLCGNGMSMALHAGKIAFECMDEFLKNKTTRKEMEDAYKNRWEKEFSKRLRSGRFIQRLFGKEFVTNLFIVSIKPFPWLIRRLIRSTYGDPF